MKYILLLFSFFFVLSGVTANSWVFDYLGNVDYCAFKMNFDPGAEAIGGTISCANTTVQLMGSSSTPGVEYYWEGPNGFTSNFQNPVVFETGVYTLTVTNPANGESSTATATVISDTVEPGASANGSILTCSNPVVNLVGNSPTSGVNYNWSGPNGFASSFQNPAINIPGTYVLVVTNPVNGCTTTASATITEDFEQPDAIALGSNLSCTIPVAQLLGFSSTPGVIYSWTGPNGFASAEQNPVVVEPGLYILTVENPANGCESVAFYDVTSDGNAPGAFATGGTLTCLQTMIQLQGSSPTPGVLYIWFGPNSFVSTDQNPVVSEPGIYLLSVINPATGCISVAMATVDEDPAPCILGPIAIDDLNNTLMDKDVEGNVITNDYDQDGGLLTLTGFASDLGSGGPYSPTVSLPGQGYLTLVDPSTGLYSFDPDPGFSGTTDAIEYEVCDSDDGLCSTATLVIEVIDFTTLNHLPVANNDHYQTVFETAVNGVVLANDFDPDGDAFTITGGTASGISNNGGLWTINGDNTFNYSPPVGYSGLDTVFIYEICDGIGACDQAVVTTFVSADDGLSNHPPRSVDDAYNTQIGLSVAGNLFDNDPNDPDVDALVLTEVNGNPVLAGGASIITVNGGTATVMPNGSFTYVPAAGYSGPDRFVYQVCDGVSGCDYATVNIAIMPENCITVDLSVFLQGPYLPGQLAMQTFLNTQRGLLPGQTPANPLVTPTPTGNPYRGAPWNYIGTTAEEAYDGPYVNGSGLAVTDWVLVSFRTTPDPAGQFLQANGLLYEDGHVEFVEPCMLRISDPSTVWIVIEHRNHVGVMSDTAVTVQDGSLIYDFRQTESFRTPASFGQNQLEPGVFMMFAADGDQTDNPGYDINGSDNAIWLLDNGSFDIYLISDFNLNGDVSGQDNFLFNSNNGIFSAVPKD